MPIKNQTYLYRMQKSLSNKIMSLERHSYARPTTVNVTFVKRKKRIVKFMFGTSIKCGIKPGMTLEDSAQVRMDATQSRVKEMTIFQWNLNSALIERESGNCSYAWGMRSESVPWEGLGGLKA